MCGRTCCTLAPGLVPYACTTVTKNHEIPKWVDAPDGGEYYPSTNIPPTGYTPILFSKNEGSESDSKIKEEADVSAAIISNTF